MDEQTQQPQLEKLRHQGPIDSSTCSSSVDSSTHSPGASSPTYIPRVSSTTGGGYTADTTLRKLQVQHKRPSDQEISKTCSKAGLDMYMEKVKTLGPNELLDRMISHQNNDPKEKLPLEFYRVKGEVFEKENEEVFEKELEQTTGIRLFKRPRQENTTYSTEERDLPPRKQPAAQQQQQRRLTPETQQEGNMTVQQIPASAVVDSSAVPGTHASVNACTHSRGTAAAAPSSELDIIWPKLQCLKAKYLTDLRDLFALLEVRSTMPISPGQLNKLKQYKEVLYRIIPYLTVPKEKLPKEFNQEKAELLEREIVRIMETFKRRKQVNLERWRQQAALYSPLPPQLRLPSHQIQQRNASMIKPTQQIQVLSENGKSPPGRSRSGS